MARLNSEYADGASGWASDAALAYGPMAAHLVSRCPVQLQGCLALDAGAGTGAASEILASMRATVVAADLELAMVSRAKRWGMPSVADVTALPFRSGAFNVAIAAFVLNHLDDPVRGLAELRSATKQSGVILASAFSLDRAPAKSAIDAVAVRHGWKRPAWYGEMQRRAAAVATIDQMATVAHLAGLSDAEVTDTELNVGLHDAHLVVRYRLGMPQFGEFADSLSLHDRDQFVHDCVDAVEATNEPFRPRVVELVAHVP